MNNTVRKDIFNILERVIEILEEKDEKDFIELKELSNHTIHNSSIFQDDDSISAAVMVYALAKLIDRGIPEKTYDMIFSKITTARDALAMLDYSRYKQAVKGIFQIIRNVDKKLNMYFGDVILQAQMKKAGRIYHHGISAGIVSELTGISQWELLNYLGKTSVVEDYNPRDIKKRLAYARKVFNIR